MTTTKQDKVAGSTSEGSEPTDDQDERFIEACWEAASRIYEADLLDGATRDSHADLVQHVGGMMIISGVNAHTCRESNPGWSGFAMAAAKTMCAALSYTIICDQGGNGARIFLKMVSNELGAWQAASAERESTKNLPEDGA